MSIKINLEFQTKFDLDFLSNGIAIQIIRLLGNVHLKGKKSWSPEEKAIIDTGNPITIIPYSIWQPIEKKKLIESKTKLFGLTSTEETALSGILAEITIVFKDEQEVSRPQKIKAILLDCDRSPFIIGYEDVLTNACLISDYKNKIAMLKFD